MKNNHNDVEVSAQGVETSKEVDVPQIRKWLRHDLGTAITALNAIQADPDLFESMCQFLYGRIQNARLRKEPDLFGNPEKPE